MLPSRSILPTKRAARPDPNPRWHLARQALRRHSVPLAVGGALAAGVLAAAVVLLPPLHQPASEDSAELAAVEEEEDAGVEQVVGLADGGVDDSVLAAASRPTYGGPRYVMGDPIPKKPDPGQKRPPCSPPEEQSINGGCWSVTLRKPPCEDYYEHDGRCFLPVLLGTRRQPTSEDP